MTALQTPQTMPCTAVRRRLAEFYDGELPVQKRIAVQAHLNACSACVEDLRGYEEVSSAFLRGGEGTSCRAVQGERIDASGVLPSRGSEPV